MNVSVRSCLRVGVATITAAVVALAPSVEVSTPRSTTAQIETIRVVAAPVHLVAAAQPAVTTLALPSLLTDWVQRIVIPPSAGAPFPQPHFPPVIGGNSIDSAIKNVYNATEPWVRYGFELATYAIGWVPYVGWLAPQVMIFYNFGERIVRSITFNIADFLGGQVSFVDGLINVGVDTINSFIYLANDELAFWLPPLPPIPPIGPFSAAATTLKVASEEPVPDGVLSPPTSAAAVRRTAVETAQATPDQTAILEPSATLEPSESVEPSETPKPTKTPKPAKPTLLDGVQAQGEIRGPHVTSPATSTTTTTTKDTATGTDTTTGSKPAKASKNDADKKDADKKDKPANGD